jgi:hypothetical protein
VATERRPEGRARGKEARTLFGLKLRPDVNLKLRLRVKIKSLDDRGTWCE